MLYDTRLKKLILRELSNKLSRQTFKANVKQTMNKHADLECDILDHGSSMFSLVLYITCPYSSQKLCHVTHSLEYQWQWAVTWCIYCFSISQTLTRLSNNIIYPFYEYRISSSKFLDISQLPCSIKWYFKLHFAAPHLAGALKFNKGMPCI